PTGSRAVRRTIRPREVRHAVDDRMPLRPALPRGRAVRRPAGPLLRLRQPPADPGRHTGGPTGRAPAVARRRGAGGPVRDPAGRAGPGRRHRGPAVVAGAAGAEPHRRRRPHAEEGRKPPPLTAAAEEERAAAGGATAASAAALARPAGEQAAAAVGPA